MAHKTIYIYMDDSGKMSKKEKCFSFGGIYFLEKDKKDKFEKQYKEFINNNKCEFCYKQKNKCDFNCLEIKSNNTNSNFRKKVLKIIKYDENVYTYAVTIYNDKIEDDVFKNKLIKGRRIDYYQKRVIKEIIKKLLKENKINKKDDLNIEINIDEGKMRSNGMYTLNESVFKELKLGMTNIKKQTYFPPIISGELNVNTNYLSSKNNYLIQSSDFLVGYINATMIWHKNNNEFLTNFLIF